MKIQKSEGRYGQIELKTESEAWIYGKPYQQVWKTTIPQKAIENMTTGKRKTDTVSMAVNLLQTYGTPITKHTIRALCDTVTVRVGDTLLWTVLKSLDFKHFQEKGMAFYYGVFA